MGLIEEDISPSEERIINTGEKELTINFDGSYRFSFGKHEFGCGWVMKLNGVFLVSKSFGGETKGPYSSNAAEYRALKDAIEFLMKFENIEFDRLKIIGDSRLVINQISKKWKIHSGIYVVEAKKVKDYLDRNFHNNIEFVWVSRNNNQEADELSKEGLNNYSRQ